MAAALVTCNQDDGRVNVLLQGPVCSQLILPIWQTSHIHKLLQHQHCFGVSFLRALEMLCQKPQPLQPG